MKVNNKPEVVRQMIANEQYKSVRVTSRVSPHLFLQAMNKGDMIGIYDESTIIKMALKEWVKK